ncbi:alpha/beta fold hydrolase [Lederbergia citri]|uniref:Alpha/beta hydrolase n=1 Tax=Lederbergia citri TaxID=2833580 RepID=A0A942TJV1_9BACI|nr:alpha/beta hydrolase [Lederbergia citri]MBS4197339.1 alpha/beta hydrolase [Lederbergia citri]
MNRKKKFITICILLFLLAVIGLFLPTWTPDIKGKNSISTLEQVDINGTKLEVMIRDNDRSNPIIIFVHGGPGCSEIPYVRKYQDELEKNFTIVHYDQRGSGKSYHFFEDYSNLSSDLHVEDLLELTDHIKELMGQEKVILIGHSYGTYIGMKAASKAPDKFSMYIGIGQVSDTGQSELDSLNFVLNEATTAGDLKDIKKLENLRSSIENGEMLTPRNLVRKYGGASRLINDNMDYYLGFLFSPEYNLLDVIRYIKGVSLSQKILIPEEREHDITSIVDKLDIPCFIVMGNFDYMTSVNAAKTYFHQIEAPVKDFIIFDKSAHYPQFEQKELFADWLHYTWKEFNN